MAADQPTVQSEPLEPKTEESFEERSVLQEISNGKR